MLNKLSERQKGYGWPHIQLRRVWEPRVKAGGVICWRCGRPIIPGEPWELGHDDHDRSRYRGPEHRKCNRQTSKPKLFSRKW